MRNLQLKMYVIALLILAGFTGNNALALTGWHKDVSAAVTRNAASANSDLHIKNAVITGCITGDVDVCEGEVVTYSVTPTAGYNYFWNVTGGTAPPTTGTSYTVTWGSAGSGTVTLVIKDNLGTIIQTCSLNVNIHPLPNPFITASFSSTCQKEQHENPAGGRKEEDCLLACDSSNVVYSTPNNPGSTYTWYVFGAISYTATGNTVSVNWGAVGNGLVRVTETTAWGCTYTVERCIEIIESPDAAFTTLPAPVGGVVTICLNQTIQFLDLSVGSIASPIISWYWTFGDGGTSTVQNPSHTYTTAGPHDVWLFVENQCHCKDSFLLKVFVNSLTGPDIICASTVCAGATDTYSTSAVCSVYNWSVTGGTINQSPPYGPTISVTWGSTGPGTVTLDVSGCTSGTYCTTPTTITIPIISPTATINGPTVVCANSLNTYSVSYLPGCVYTWSITGGGSGFSTTNSIDVYWPGTSTGGTITVNYYNPELNCSGTATINVVVRPPFTVSGATKVCSPGTETYSAPPGVYNWTVTNSSGTILQTATGGSITVNWTTPTYPIGTYQVSAVNISNQYCNSPQSVFVTLYPKPPPVTAVVGPDSICPNVPYQYSATPSSSNYYLAWVITNGTPSTATGNSVTITWGPSGPYVISLYQVQVTNPGCSSVVFTKNVYKKVLVTPTISAAWGTTCNNIVRPYSATPTNADSYTWTISPATFGSVISGQGTPNVNIQWNNSIGTAVISLVAKSCSDSVVVTKNVTLTGPPPPVITSLNVKCAGHSFAFSTPTSGTAYSWDFGDGSPFGTTASTSHIYTTPGNYNVTLTVTNPGGCIGTSSVSKFVLINPSPSANLTTPDPTAFCPGDPISTTMFINSQAGNTFQWMLNGVNIPGATGVSYTATAAGTYTVLVTSPNGCTTVSNPIVVVQLPTCIPCPVQPGSSISYTYTAPTCNVVPFNGNISSNGRILGWDFNDPLSGANNTSTLLNPTHTFTQSGYYQVIFSGLFPSTNVPDSCKLTDIQTIVIPAVADFNWKITGCSGGGYLVDFFDKSNYVSPYSITSYSWTFGGGTPSTSSLQNPSGILITPGLQTVTLTITSSAGTVCTQSYNLNIPSLPVAAFTGPSTICEGNPAGFTSTNNTNIVDWLWDFGDASGSKLNPSTQRTYTTTGLLSVSLTITDIFGCVSTVSQPINVVPNTLNVNVTAGGPTTFCQGNSVNLTANVTGGNPGYTYLWSDLSVTNPITVTQSGNYTVTVTDMLGCTRLSNATPVTVNVAPQVIIMGKTEYCLYETVELNVNQGPSNTYQWYVNGSPYTTGQVLSYYAFTPGVISVYVVTTAPNGCTSTSATVNITIHNLPLPPSISVSPIPACAGSPVLLSATNTQGLTQYEWSNGATGANITVTNAGLYTVNLYDLNGCKSQASAFVNPLPDLSNLMVGCYEFCDTADVLWIGPVGPYMYQWYLNGVPIPGATSANYNIPAGAAGVYTLEVTTFSGCTITSSAIDITFISGCGQPCPGQDSYVKNIRCGPIDANGNQTYLVDMVIFNPLASGATYVLLSSEGAFSMLSPATLVTGANLVTGVFTDIPPVDHTFCILGVITDPEGRRCEFKMCKDLPDCTPEPCHADAVLQQIACIGVDANGNPRYLVNFNFFWTGSNGSTVTIVSPDGTVSSVSAATVNSGMNTLSAIFTDLPPHTGHACYVIYVFDPVRQTTCYTKLCFKLPPCGNEPCDMAVEIKDIICDKIDANGNQTYKVSFSVYNPFGGTMNVMVTSPNGGFSGLTPVTAAPGWNSYTALFTDLPPANQIICFTVVLSNEEQSCAKEICVDLPDCTTDPCHVEVEIGKIRCKGIDQYGNFIYEINFAAYNSTSSPMDMSLVSSQGTFSGLSGNIAYPGWNGYSVLFTDVPPANGMICFLVQMVNNETNEHCEREVCIDLPKCDIDKCHADIKLDKIICIGKDADGNPMYLLDAFIHWPGADGSNIYVSSAQGAISNLSTYTLNNGGNNVGMIFTDLPQHEGFVCIDILVYDPEQDRICSLRICRDLPKCDPVKCDVKVDVEYIECLKPDANGNWTYRFKFYVDHPNNNSMTMYLTSPDGGFTNLSSNTVNPGTNWYDVVFTDLPPASGTICFTVVLVDDATGEVCIKEVCVDLPQCGEASPSASTRMINAQDNNLLALYPNPAGNQTTISYSFASEGDHVIEVRDVVGKLVQSFKVDNREGTIQFNTSQLASGAYSVTAYDHGTSLGVKKLVIIK